MKIAAGICEYADPTGLYRCLGSLAPGYRGGIDLAIVIHSRFSNFPLQKPEALTETSDIISRFPSANVQLVNAGSLTEIEARNLYLKTAGENGCDWLLVIDTDEFVAPNADWSKFRQQLEFVMSLKLPHQIFDIQFEGLSAAYRGPRPRLFYRPATIKYWKRHFWWVLEEQHICLRGMGDAGRIIDGIYLMHDGTVRQWDQAYHDASYQYKDWQQKFEG